MVHPKKIPSLVFADSSGNICDFDELDMTGMSNRQFFRPSLEDIIPLPAGSELFTLPGRFPVGWDSNSAEPALLQEDPFSPGNPVQAVAAFIAPAHTSIYSSSYHSQTDAPLLPLFAYTAVGWYDDQFWVTAFRSDQDIRQDFDQYEQSDVERCTRQKLKQYRNNRLIQHLGKCCLTYGCPAARNYFLSRWEAPLPTSPTCNARCLGCISLQPSGCCPSTQDRIKFVPTPREISQLAIAHLSVAEKPIVSFGQGCEGEPLMQAAVIEESISQIRAGTNKGTINLNSNASLPGKVKRLASAGLNSLRVSINSAQPHYYDKYHRPQNYCFADVMQSILEMKEQGRFVSLNYFILPGFTDSEPEFHALCDLVEKHKPDFIQLRNLNMDPEWYFNSLSLPPEQNVFGIRNWLKQLGKQFPSLKFGYFNPEVSRLKQ